MFFRKQFEARVGKNEMIMTELLSNAFRSVQHQVKETPLCDYLHLPRKMARCRLNLYAMNNSILNYFLISNLKKKSQQYVNKLHVNLVETICSADPMVVENIKDLIIDKKLISILINDDMLKDKFKILSKKDLLSKYILNRSKEYHYAINIKTKLISKYGYDKVQPYLTGFPVTNVFVKDFLGDEYKDDSEFVIKFSHNISMRSLSLFSQEIDEILN